jgi:multidrug efflux system outer membrane protein
MNRLIKHICVAVGISAIAACSVTKKYEQPKDLQVEKIYRGVNVKDTISMAELPWQQLFTDTILQKLIKIGLDKNYDLKIALTRIEAANAALQQSKQAFLPSLSVDANISRVKASSAQAAFNTNTNNIFALTGTTSWEADIWRKLNSNKKASIAAYLKSAAYSNAVKTQVIANIANSYFKLLAYDEQIKIVEQTILIRLKDVETIKELKKAAVVTGADLVNSEAVLHSAELQLPDLKQSRRELENAMSILLALPPDSIPRSTFGSQKIKTALNTGLSSQLLAYRPDVQQAEYAFRNAFEITNVARTYFYPSLTITGTGGWATSNTLQQFFSGNSFYGSLIAGITQPIFNQGINKQRLRTAIASQQEAYYSFQNTLLTAGQEVSNALYAYKMALEKQETRQMQIASLTKASEYTKELLKYSSATNYTDVLTAEQNLLTAQLSSISDKLQELQSVVNLYKALGGGWK